MSDCPNCGADMKHSPCCGRADGLRTRIAALEAEVQGYQRSVDACKHEAGRLLSHVHPGAKELPSLIGILTQLSNGFAFLEAENKRLAAEAKSLPKAWPDGVPLMGPNRPANDGSTAWLVGYLLTVLKRFGNTCVTADLQWGAQALHVENHEKAENNRLVAERDGWKERAQRAEAEAMTLRDFERVRQRSLKKQPQDGDDGL